MDGVLSASSAQPWVRTKDSPVTTNLLIVCEVFHSWWQPPVIDNSVQDYDYIVLENMQVSMGGYAHTAFFFIWVYQQNLENSQMCI